MKNFKLIAVAATLATCALSAHAERAEAEALLTAALAEHKAKGAEGAGREISAGGTWVKGSTYVFVCDFKATVTAHSVNPKMVGKNLWEVKDAAGKLFVQDQVRQMQAAPRGSVTMRWMNPVTKQIGDAEALLARVPGSESYIGAVYFK